MSCSVLSSSPPLLRACVFPSFLASIQTFSLGQALNPQVYVSPEVFIVFLFVDTNWFLKPFLLCCLLSLQRVCFQLTSFISYSPKVLRGGGEQGAKSQEARLLALAWPAESPFLNSSSHTNNTETVKQGASEPRRLCPSRIPASELS